MPSEKRSSTEVLYLVAGAVLAVATVILAVLGGLDAVSVALLVTALGAAASFALYLTAREKQRHELETARLANEAEARESERLRLSDQLVSAEQEERRRLADQLHDGAVQSLSGIALMLDAGIDSIEQGRLDEAKSVLGGALERHRDTIRSLRDLSFNLEPVVLRDQGFTPAVQALAETLGLAHEIQIDVDVDAGEELTEHAQAALYQIVREALTQAIRRGPPTRIQVGVERTDEGGFELVVADDAPAERRRASFDAIAERARTLSGNLAVEQGQDGGTAVHVVLPGSFARA